MGKTRRSFTKDFKQDTVSLVLNQGYKVAEAARSLDVSEQALGRWVRKYKNKDGQEFTDNGIQSDEQIRIRERVKLKYEFIRKEKNAYPIKYLCDVLGVSRSPYYAYIKQHDDIPPRFSGELKSQAKEIFDSSDRSYDSRRMSKALRVLGYDVGRSQARTLMKDLQLKVKYSKPFKATTNSKHPYPIAKNILNREFSVTEVNKFWGTDIAYLWTEEGRLYPAIVIDLFSRKVVD